MTTILRALRTGAACLVACLLVFVPVAGQGVGTVEGRIIHVKDQSPAGEIVVSVQDLWMSTPTDRAGRFVLPAVPSGDQTLILVWPGFLPQTHDVTVVSGQTVTLELTVTPTPVPLGEIEVVGASRQPERLVEAPAAVNTVTVAQVRDQSTTGQLPQTLKTLTGVDVVQSGVQDFNISTRGFNTMVNRRVVVLQDGRDLATPALGNQEWSALAMPLDDFDRIEMVRGPGSALYGASAFSGVLNLVTPSARQSRGGKITVGGGGLGTRRADGRFGGVTKDLRIGYRVNAGYYRSDSWDQSRTDIGDLEREYAPAIDLDEYPPTPPVPGYELKPLRGQTKDGQFGVPGPSLGTADPVVNVYGSARLDYYFEDGSMLTGEGGNAWVNNMVFTTPLGRTQVYNAIRPWARVAWSREDLFVTGYYSGRVSGDQFTLASGTANKDDSHLFHLEGQYSRAFAAERGRFVLGGSARSTRLSTAGTILPPEFDDRTDQYYSAFGQASFRVTDKLEVVVAGRFDDSNLYDAQFSPRAAVVLHPAEGHAIRAGVNQAFQTATPIERFLRLPAGAPVDLTQLEAGLRQSELGPALGGVPEGELFTNSSAVPIWAIGNPDLKVEGVTSIEVGYKGVVGSKGFLTADVFYSRFTDFITDLLPGVNPAFPPWSAPEEVPEPARAPLEGAVQGAVGTSLSRLQDGSTAFVLSIGNAGEATSWGFELGAGINLSEKVTLDANYTFFDFDVDASTLVPGDSVLPNTPTHKANVSAAYEDTRGLSVRASLRLTSAYDWAGGVYGGRVPALQTVDLSAGYDITPNVRVHGVATNILDQSRYQMFGGAVIGRRVLGGVTLRF